MNHFFRRHRWLTIILTILYILILGWLGDALKGDDMFVSTLGLDAGKWRWRIIGALSGLTIALVILTKIVLSKDAAFTIPNRAGRAVVARPALVLHLSTSTRGIEFDKLARTVTWRDDRIGNTGTVLAHVQLTADLQTDIAKLDAAQSAARPNGAPSYWNWLQLLRGLAPHVGTMKRLYLVCSTSGANPSASQRDDAIALLNFYCIGRQIEAVECDFGDVQALMDVLHKIIEKEKTDHRSGDDEIIIDCTGGNKPTSIAAAMVTATSAIEFQYVPDANSAAGSGVRAYQIRAPLPSGVEHA